MVIYSMTGFGAGNARKAGIVVDAELSSVNRKQLDVRLSLPRNLAKHEAELAAVIRQSFERGHITGHIRVSMSDSARQSRIRLDKSAAKAWVDELRTAGSELRLEDDLSLKDLVGIPGLIEEVTLEEDDALMLQLSYVALKQAVSRLQKMRAGEGRALKKDISTRLKTLKTYTTEISQFAPALATEYRDRLMKRIQDSGVSMDSHDGSLNREVAVYAERCDITEELIRLRSHSSQALQLMKNPDGPVGRTLDFIAQEMFREINTIGAKASQLEISQKVVAFKSELERIREQIQNLE